MRLFLALFLAACSSPSTNAHDAATTIDGSGTIDAPAAIDGSPPGNAYDTDGTVPYTVMSQQVMGAGHTINVTVYMPTTSGKHPVVSLSCGSQQTAAGYASYGKRLASYGIAMVATDDPGVLTNTTDVVTNAVYIAGTWIPATYPDSVDTTRMGLAGHSRGGAASLLTAEGGMKGRVVAWFGLDPVDNEFGMTPGAFARTDLAQIGIPTAFLGAEVTSNCAPTADSYPTLSPLAPSPSVLVVGIGAGHTQLELASGCSLCTICSPSGTADPDVVLAYSTRYFTAFFARELLGDTSVGAAFEGAGAASDVAAGHVTVMAK